jgi:ferritin-like metal-binding protein YciE
MASMESLEELLQEEVKDLYDAEKQLTKALPKMIKKATADALKEALESHLRETEQHVERLEQIFEQLEMPARGKKCQGMQNLIAEGNDMIGDAEDDAVRDAVMIAAAQKAEHYEIASYGTVRTWANVLGKTDIAELLEETLEEEKAADEKLTSIAESFVNEAASEGDEDEEEAAPVSRRAPAGARSSARIARPVAADRGRSKTSRSR